MVKKTVIATPQLAVSKIIKGNMDTFRQKLDPKAALVIGGKLELKLIGENGIETIEFEVMDVTKFDMSFFVDDCIEVESESDLLLI
jgi:hypothetical protein